LTRAEKVVKMSAVEFMNWMAYLKEKGENEQRIRKQLDSR
jgi:hypothetical protein